MSINPEYAAGFQGRGDIGGGTVKSYYDKFKGNNPNLQWISGASNLNPNASQKDKQRVQDYHNTIIGATLPIPGLETVPFTKGALPGVLPSIFKPGKRASTFKSEINWGKWNKEIPGNTALMDEYKHIEQVTKSRGTWMKNADGSDFTGTPEQFIQQKSRNFNVNMPNVVRTEGGNIQTNYHGSPHRFEVFDEKMFNVGIYGKGIYTTPNIEAMENYAKFRATKGSNKVNPTQYELYINSKTPITGEIIDDLYTKKGPYDFMDDKMTPRWQTEGWDFLQIKDPGLRGYDEAVMPFSNYPKSMIGNRGTFDMTNPNIYKQKGGLRTSPIMMESPRGLQPTQTDINVKKIRDTYNTDKNPLRADMIKHLHRTGRDTNYVNLVMSNIAQHESKGDPTSQQDGGGPGRGMFQYEEGFKKAGNTAINNTMNFLNKFLPNRKNVLHTRDNLVYKMHKDPSADLSKLDKNTQEGIFIGDKIFGGTDQRDDFDKLVKNRKTPPTSDEMFEFWGKRHKRIFSYKDKDENTIKYSWDKLPADKKAIEKKKWKARTGTIKRKGGYKSKYC